MWDEDFFFTAKWLPDGRLQGRVQFTVWDSDVTKDTVIGACSLDLTSVHPEDLGLIELPLTLTEKVQKVRALKVDEEQS